MLKTRYSLSLSVLLVLCFISFYYVFGSESDAENCRLFLKNYGWETQITPDDSSEITIPAIFDAVYTNYNELQKIAGLDLLPYRGKNGTRYTFIVTNYPLDIPQTVYANVICIDGVPVGGDIMTANLDGFMHAVSENTP